MATVRIHGVPISESQARSLVLALVEDGSKHALSAGEIIARGIANKLMFVGLTQKEQEAVLGVLDSPRQPALVELREALASERERV
jgi:hypothetical protein